MMTPPAMLVAPVIVNAARRNAHSVHVAHSDRWAGMAATHC
jgi:hypothetical protein